VYSNLSSGNLRKELNVKSVFRSIFLNEHNNRFEIKLLYSLSDDFEAKINNLIKQGFADIDKDKYFSLPYAYLVAIEQENIISVTALFKRQLTYNRQTVNIGAFGYLTTAKKKRRRGVATALLKRGIEDFKSKNFDIAFLCTDINDPGLIKLYNRVGFFLLRKSYTYIGKSGAQYTEDNGMIASINCREKFELVQEGQEVLNLGVGSF
jgi:GNAT superfamily N-acetyltransferase